MAGKQNIRKRYSEGGAASGVGSVQGKDRVAPMVAVEEMVTGKSSRSRGGVGGGGSKSGRGIGERIAGTINALASGKSGQKRSADDDAATRRRNTGKK